MKAFEFDHDLINSYALFTRSFSTIRSEDLRSEVQKQYEGGRFWPDPLLSLNPKFLSGPTVDDLVDSGDLNEATGKIFHVDGSPIKFHRHQAQSIAKAQVGQSYVVTTEIGSGKSLCFFVPVVDAIVRSRKAGQPGFKPAFDKLYAGRYIAQLRSVADGILDQDDCWIAGLPDYGMTSGKAEIRIRRALLYYALRRLGLDADPTTRQPHEQQIVLLNREGMHEIHG